MSWLPIGHCEKFQFEFTFHFVIRGHLFHIVYWTSLCQFVSLIYLYLLTNTYTYVLILTYIYLHTHTVYTYTYILILIYILTYLLILVYTYLYLFAYILIYFYTYLLIYEPVRHEVPGHGLMHFLWRNVFSFWRSRSAGNFAGRQIWEVLTIALVICTYTTGIISHIYNFRHTSDTYIHS